jgi:hypothetical protein
MREAILMATTIDVVNLTVTTPARYEVTIKGMDGILFNRMPDMSKPKAEKAKAEKVDPLEVERATWREKSYFDSTGGLYIPGENVHECLYEGSKYWGARIAGEGKKTYSDLVKSAVIVENLPLGISKDSEKMIPFGKNVNSNPSKGKKSGSKVYKIRPLLRPWGGTFIMHVFDARLTPEILRTIIAYAGVFRGMCDWRPVFGRFELEGIKEL